MNDESGNRKKGHISLDWHNLIASDQLSFYTNNAPENEHANELKDWEEHLERITDESRDTDLEVRWWEYRGKSVMKGKKPPLVIALYEYFNTCWQYIADREGLVVAAFEYHRNQRNPEGGLGALGFGPKADEIEAYDIVLERLITKYNCDRGRVYMHGLSYGDFSSLVYASKYGYKLAGLASTNGPMCAYNLKRYGMDETLTAAVPVIQVRSDDDFTCDGFPAGHAFKLEGNEEWIRHIRSLTSQNNRNLWLRTNGCDVTRPEIHTEKTRAFLRYPSETGDVIYAEYAAHCHVAPPDIAEVVWDELFSRYMRDSSGMIREIKEAQKPDEKAAAFVCGCRRALIDGEVVKLPTECLMLDPRPALPRSSEMYLKTECSYSSFYVSVKVLKLFFGLNYSYASAEYDLSNVNKGEAPEELMLKDGYIAFVHEGKKYRLLTNSPLAMVDDKVISIDRPCLWLSGKLMIPLCEVASLLGYNVSCRNEVYYVTSHPFTLGYSFSRFLREEILPESVYVREYSLAVEPAVHGKVTVLDDNPGRKLAYGETVMLSVEPESGFKVQKAEAFMDGVSVLVNKISDTEYWVCNISGDTIVRFTFG